MVVCLLVSATACRDRQSPTSPPPPGPVTLASLSVSPSQVDGGTAAEGTATLSGSAPAGGTLVSLSSSSAAAAVPASITVPAGATSATFAVTTSPVSALTTVTILGSSGGANRDTTLRLLAAESNTVPLATLESRHDDLVGGRNSSGTITLAEAAPSGGVIVRLTSDDEALEVPAEVTIPAGGRSGTFEIRTEPVATARDVTISAAAAIAGLRPASATLTMRIRLLPVGNRAPAAANDTYATDEDTALIVAAPGVLDNDTDANGDALTADLVDDVDDGTLALSADGSFTYTPAADFTGSDSFTYRASDGPARSDPATVTITVGGSNDAPTISGIANQSVVEDEATSALAFTVGDQETAAGSLTVSGSSSNTTLVPTANIVFGGSGANRTVTVTPAANQSGTATITITVNDGTASASETFTLTVGGNNDTPTISDIANQTIDEDGATGALTFTVGDQETAAGSLTVSGSSSNTTLVPNANIVFGGSGASRTVTVTPAADQNGSATITVTVSDGTASASAIFELTVRAVNEAPSFTAGANQTVNEDSGAQTVVGWATNISAGPSNESGQTVSFAITNNTNTALFSAGPAVSSNGTLTYTPADNAAGTATITLRAEDDGGTANGGDDDSPTQQFTISVSQLIDDEITYDYTGSTQSFAVPDGITRIEIEAFGGEGGAGGFGAASGGDGGSVEATITVTPGGTLSIRVGGAGGDGLFAGGGAGGFNGGGAGGSGSFWGGGGGGASDVRQGGDDVGDRVIVAGGGGGTGANNGGHGVGGAGGGLTGGDGTMFAGGGDFGTGGTQGAGGAGGASQGCGGCTSGSAGASGAGGGGGNGTGGAGSGGGGGGGGYFGGGGGGGSTIPGGGGAGGGSSWVDPALLVGVASHQQGVRTGNGRVIIRW